VLAAEPSRLGPAERVGLLTGPTGITASLDRNVEALRAAGIPLAALLGPEHGVTGTAQAGASEGDGVDEATGLPTIDTFAVRDHLDQTIEALGLDTIVYDIQDAGARFWTFTWSMYDTMLVAARLGVRFVILDRPNPIQATIVEGPDLDPSCASFVGRVAIPQRHGLTLGELGRLFNAQFVPTAAGRPVELDVITMEGWQRDASYASTGLPWVTPSPNIPTVDSAYAFAATCLIEGTNVSEGRGTTHPFELFGAPYVDARLIPALRARELPGVEFREAWFQPTFHKYAGQAVRGAQLYVTDVDAYRAVPVGVGILATLAELYRDDFAVLDPVSDQDSPTTDYALDRLWGSPSLRTALAAGDDPTSLVPAAETPDRYPAGTLLY